MRHLPLNFQPGDHLELQLAVKAELLAIDGSPGGDCSMSIRVVDLANSSNGKRVLWRHAADGDLDLQVEVGVKQRILALGISTRQRERLKKRLTGLTSSEAKLLLAEITERDPDGRPTNCQPE